MVSGETLRRRLSMASVVAPVMTAPLAIVAAAQMSAISDVGSYWRQPLAAQGAPPKTWTAIEQSLAPSDCGQCHAEQFAQWQTSRHAHSFSPGLVGQLLTYSTAETAECLQCHAPLAEQREAFEAARDRGVAAFVPEDGLAAAGNSCGGCHLRLYRHYGPPRRGTGIARPSGAAPHGGALQTKFFETSAFCSICHQFPASLAVNGKPLENTYIEWQASPQAARGITCQSCHMPDRRHLWRGIHDPEMVASGLAPQVTITARGVRFAVTNAGVGHAFPTYATPKVAMRAVALDAAGVPRAQTLHSHEIARVVSWENDHWMESSDTRLSPGETAAIELDWDGSDRIRTWLEVTPDDFYERNVFPGLAATSPSASGARQLILKAATDTAASHFRLFETTVRKP
jgi:hypothetical protein